MLTRLIRYRYVAMHTMQENANSKPSSSNTDAIDDMELNGDRTTSGGGSNRGKEEKTELQDLIVAVAGMLIPLITQVGHHH